MLGSLLRRRRRAAAPSPPSDWKAENEARIAGLRRQGVAIGTDCVIFTDRFSLEPCLVEIGDRVAIAGGTMFLTHDGTAWLLRRTRPEAQHFGRIVVGSDTFIGQNCLILPGTRIGSNCVVGAGAVVRGTVADGTVVMGNPARVVGRTSLLVALLDASPDTLDTYTLPEDERQRRIRRHFGRPEPEAA
jgi:acetyltransferase-like isoleucine patch superfamily enzyme